MQKCLKVRHSALTFFALKSSFSRFSHVSISRYVDDDPRWIHLDPRNLMIRHPMVSRGGWVSHVISSAMANGHYYDIHGTILSRCDKSYGYPQDVNLGDTPEIHDFGWSIHGPRWISRSGHVPISRFDHLDLIIRPMISRWEP